MRSRPEILKLTVTHDARPGSDLDAHVVLVSTSKTPINGITLRLTGAEKYVRATNHPPVVARWLVTQEATLRGKGKLDAGRHELRARFRLPPNAVPTYRGKWIVVDYELRLHVDIPWWPDLVRMYTVVVAPHVTARPAPRPLSQTTGRGGAEPFIEATLDDVAFAAGDALGGAFALGNLRGRKAQSLEMAVVAVERATGQFTVEGPRYPMHFSPDIAGEGRECRFRFTLPKALAPSYETESTSLSYLLEMRVGLSRRVALVHRIPIAIGRYDRPAAVALSESAEKGGLGEARWRRMWASAGTLFGLSLDDEALELGGRIGRSEASIFLDPDAKETALVAELRFASIEIGLRVRLRRLALFATDEGDGFGKRYKVSGRDAAQTRQVLSTKLRKALLGFDEAYVDDERARVLFRAQGYDDAHLAEFLRRVTALAGAIDEASMRVPPPSPMASMEAAWRAFASEVDGELTVGSMAIRNGTVEGARFELETVFEEDPAPTHTRLALLLDPPLGDEFQAPALFDVLPESGGSGLTRAVSAGAPPGTREIYAEVAKEAREVRVTRHAIEVTLEAPLADPASLHGRMMSMLALGRKLRGDKGAGPYR